MRLLLLAVVIALLVDALLYSGAYTQSIFRHVTVAADQFRERLDDAGSTGSTGGDLHESTDTVQL